jgi:hypothetical protein
MAVAALHENVVAVSELYLVGVVLGRRDVRVAQRRTLAFVDRRIGELLQRISRSLGRRWIRRERR